MALSFDLTAEQNILRQSVREFAEKEIKPVARELDAREEFSYELTRKMGDMGLFGIFVSEEYGGSHLDYVSYIIAVEEIAAEVYMAIAQKMSQDPAFLEKVRTQAASMVADVAEAQDDAGA